MGNKKTDKTLLILWSVPWSGQRNYSIGVTSQPFEADLDNYLELLCGGEAILKTVKFITNKAGNEIKFDFEVTAMAGPEQIKKLIHVVANMDDQGKTAIILELKD